MWPVRNGVVGFIPGRTQGKHDLQLRMWGQETLLQADGEYVDPLVANSVCVCVFVCLSPHCLCTVTRRLTTGIPSEKYVVRRFRRCANAIQCTYTNPDSTVQPTAHLRYMV